jgi:hypothetical protein
MQPQPCLTYLIVTSRKRFTRWAEAAEQDVNVKFENSE